MSSPALRLGRVLPHQAEQALARAEADLGRRPVFGGVAGAAALLAMGPVAARTLPGDRTSTSPEGIVRTHA